MTNPTDLRAPRKSYCKGWAWSNWGVLIGVEATRARAVQACEDHTQKPWKECKEYMEVWKCEVIPK